MHEKVNHCQNINRKNLASCFFLLQGIASIAWWYQMFSNDRLRYIFFGPLPWDVVRSFVGPDAVFYLVGSFLCAWAIKQSAQYRVAALLLMTGGCGYATLLNVGLACTIKTGWVGPCLMLASLVCTVIMAFSHSQREPDK